MDLDGARLMGQICSFNLEGAMGPMGDTAQPLCCACFFEGSHTK